MIGLAIGILIVWILAWCWVLSITREKRLSRRYDHPKPGERRSDR